MKRNFDQELADLDGKPVRLGITQEGFVAVFDRMLPKLPEELQKEFNEELAKVGTAPLTFKDVCIAVLMSAFEDEQKLDDTARMSRMELARRIHKGGIQEITPKDRDLIKPLVKKKFGGILIPVITAEFLEEEYVPPTPD